MYWHQPEVLDLALPNQILNRSRNIFDGNSIIDAMLVKQTHNLRLDALQRCLSDLLDVLWTAVHPGLLAVLNMESKLRWDHHLFAKWRQRFADEFFVRKRALDLRRIEESDAALGRVADELDRFGLAERPAVAEVEAHAAEADRRNFEAALSEFSLLHCLLRYPFVC